MVNRKGPKPKPTHLRLVDGTHRTARHGNMTEAAEATKRAEAQFGRPERPRWMKGKAREAWISYIEPAGWLDRTREPAAIAFCELWAEFRERPAVFPAAKHSQMRAYMAELGLVDERNRSMAPPPPEDEFFGRN